MATVTYLGRRFPRPLRGRIERARLPDHPPTRLRAYREGSGSVIEMLKTRTPSSPCRMRTASSMTLASGSVPGKRVKVRSGWGSRTRTESSDRRHSTRPCRRSRTRCRPVREPCDEGPVVSRRRPVAPRWDLPARGDRRLEQRVLHHPVVNDPNRGHPPQLGRWQLLNFSPPRVRGLDRGSPGEQLSTTPRSSSGRPRPRTSSAKDREARRSSTKRPSPSVASGSCAPL